MKIKYTTQPQLWVDEYLNYYPDADTIDVIETQHKAQSTGLYDQYGNELYRFSAPRAIGFHADMGD